MQDLFVRVKGIVKKDGKYLLLKRWVDDRIPDPFIWEFVDGVVNHGEAPDDAVKRSIHEALGVDGSIDKILYTWSGMQEETQWIGIAYLCSVNEDDAAFALSEDFGEYCWVKRTEFEQYIENPFVLKDLEDVTL
ncbi:MAG: NUDIX domain-containing protein [Lachnospiraceae bacterium]|nr:NUDIX domain-containing protein [Lachnospiraceae bacterium]